MTKEIPNEVLELIRQLLVFDNYTKASARGGDFGTESRPGHEVFFERLIHAIFPRFLTSSPFDVTSPAIVRNGEVPLEAHIESGANASFIKHPGLIKEALGSEESRLNVPDRIVRVAGAEVAYVYIDDINLRPADTVGNVELHWHSGTGSLMLTIECETAGVEIRGESFAGTSVSTDAIEVVVRVFLKPRITRGRLLWDWGAMSFVSEGELSISSGEPVPLIGTAYDAVTAAFRAQISSFFPGPGNAEHTSGADGLASGLVSALVALFARDAELIGNAFMSLPLRPGSVRSTSLDDFLRPLLTLAGISIDRLGEREQFLLGTVTGYFTDPSHDMALDAALGMQNLLRVFPLVGAPPGQLLATVNGIINGLRDAWVRELGRELSPDERFHLSNTMVPRELESFLVNHIELSHMVDRLATYNSFTVDEEAQGIVNFDNPDDNPVNPVLVLSSPVPCMRYRVSLELLELVGDDRKAFAVELQRTLDALPGSVTPQLAVEWEIYSFHGAFGDPLAEASWERDASTGRLAGAELVQRESRFVSFRGIRTLFRDRGITNGTDGLLSKELYLEWSTQPTGTAIDAKLLIIGTVFATFAPLSSGEFKLVVPMTPAIGLLGPALGTVSSGDVDGVITFSTEASGGQFHGIPYHWRVFARLVQRPFSSNYESINISIESLLILKPRSAMPFVQLEGILNGVTFQTSRIIEVPSPFPESGFGPFLGAGWSQDIASERPAVADSFELELVLHVLEADAFRSERQIALRKTFMRFSDEHGNRVMATDDALETAVDRAVEAGAVLEWGIPIGLSVYNVRLQDNENDPQVAVTVRITKKNLVRTPPEFATRRLQMDYPKVVFTEATGGSGADEVKFFPFVEHIETMGGTDLEPTLVMSQSTRRFDAYEGDEIIFPGPPGGTVECHPGRSRLRIGCSGREYDPPFSRSSLGRAELGLVVPVDSSVDDTYVEESQGRRDGTFEMHVIVTTTSGPPKARLIFQGRPEGIDFQLSAVGATVMLEYQAGWADRLSLLKREAEESAFRLERDLGSTLASAIAVNPARTTFYRIRSVAGAFAEDSREIQVFIP